jgi:hypothetical protein
MISIIIYELAVIAIYLSLRALMPELFVGVSPVKATAPVRRRVGARTTTPHFIRRMHNDDPSRAAGMGMMIH